MTDNKRVILYKVITVALIAVQVAVAILFAQNDTYASETLKYATAVYDGKGFMAVAPFMSLIGLLCGIINVHPLIFAHNAMPVIVIPLAYYSCLFLLGKIFKSDKDHKYTAFYFICLLNIYGYWSGALEPVSLLTGYFTGTGIVVNIVIPLVLGFVLHRIPVFMKKGDALPDMPQKDGITPDIVNEGTIDESDEYMEEWDMKKHPVINARNLAIALAVLAAVLLASVFVLNNKINTLYDATVNLQNQLNEYVEESGK